LTGKEERKRRTKHLLLYGTSFEKNSHKGEILGGKGVLEKKIGRRGEAETTVKEREKVIPEVASFSFYGREKNIWPKIIRGRVWEKKMRKVSWGKRGRLVEQDLWDSL